jgi:predicted neuraminidase
MILPCTFRQAVCTFAFLSCAAFLPAQAPASSGFIFEPVSSGHALPSTPPSSHASTLVELSNGDLFAAWFTGTHEGSADVTIHGARFTGGAWSAPFELAHASGVPCWNPVLFQSADGRLWLYYKFGKSPDTWAGARKFSDDEGQTWSAEEQMPKGILGPIKDKPLVLGDGVIVSGSSVEHGDWTVWIEHSVDNGRTWTKTGPIKLPKKIDTPAPIPTPGTKTVGIIQPTIVQLEGRHLRFYARSKSRAARIAAADSSDAGKTWSEPHFINLPNPNSGIDAVRLRDGRVVLIFNNSYTGRTPLNLAMSHDGEHFSVFKTLEDTPGEYSYPAIIQAADGDLLMTYTWHRETIKFVRIPLTAVPQS